MNSFSSSLNSSSNFTSSTFISSVTISTLTSSNLYSFISISSTSSIAVLISAVCVLDKNTGFGSYSITSVGFSKSTAQC